MLRATYPGVFVLHVFHLFYNRKPFFLVASSRKDICFIRQIFSLCESVLNENEHRINPYTFYRVP